VSIHVSVFWSYIYIYIYIYIYCRYFSLRLNKETQKNDYVIGKSKSLTHG